MKRMLAGGLIGVFVFLVTPMVIAETTPLETPTQPAVTENVEDLKKRIDERKNRLKPQLDDNQTKQIADKCSGAQGKLGALAARFENSDKPYRAKYDNYLKRLEKLQIRLKQSNTDTAQLDAQIAALKEKSQILKTSVDQFLQSVNDAKTVDCKGDPTGFRAAIDDAKNAAVSLKAARVDLEKYVQETIKPIIEQLKAQRKSVQEQR